MSAALSHRLTAKPVSLSCESWSSQRPRSPLTLPPLAATVSRYVFSKSFHEPARSFPHVMRMIILAPPSSFDEADLLQVCGEIPIVRLPADLAVAELDHRRAAHKKWPIGGREAGEVLRLPTVEHPFHAAPLAIGADEARGDLETQICKPREDACRKTA